MRPPQTQTPRTGTQSPGVGVGVGVGVGRGVGVGVGFAVGLGVGVGVRVGRGVGSGSGGGRVGAGGGGAGVGPGVGPCGGGWTDPGGGVGPGRSPGSPGATATSESGLADGDADRDADGDGDGRGLGDESGPGVTVGSGTSGHSPGPPHSAVTTRAVWPSPIPLPALSVRSSVGSEAVSTTDQVNRLTMATTSTYQRALAIPATARLTARYLSAPGPAGERTPWRLGWRGARLTFVSRAPRGPAAWPQRAGWLASASDLRFSADCRTSISICRPMTGPSSWAMKPPGSS